MKGFLRNSILSVAVAATTLTAIPTANAGHWDRRDRHVHIHKKKSSDGDALAAGIVGAAIGAIAAGVLSQPRRSERVYIDPPAPRYRYYEQRTYRPAPTYRSTATYGAEPWSSAWYRACDARYRSFDPSSGTYMGYDGQRHFCVIN